MPGRQLLPYALKQLRNLIRASRSHVLDRCMEDTLALKESVCRVEGRRSNDRCQHLTSEYLPSLTTETCCLKESIKHYASSYLRPFLLLFSNLLAASTSGFLHYLHFSKASLSIHSILFTHCCRACGRLTIFRHTRNSLFLVNSCILIPLP